MSAAAIVVCCLFRSLKGGEALGERLAVLVDSVLGEPASESVLVVLCSSLNLLSFLLLFSPLEHYISRIDLGRAWGGKSKGADREKETYSGARVVFRKVDLQTWH
jgi:hypothetical protein